MDENRDKLHTEVENTDGTSKTSAGSSESQMNTGHNGKKRLRVIAPVYAMVAVLLLSVLLGLGCYTLSVRRRLANLYTKSGTLQITLLDVRGETQTLQAEINELVFIPSEPEHRGVTCIGWMDAAGNRVLPGLQKFTQSEELHAEYMPAFGSLEEHEPYLFPDEMGCFNLSQLMTRGKAAEIIGLLAAEEAEKEVTFTDLEKADPAWRGAVLLAQFGLIQDNTFFPEQNITQGELLCWLSQFFAPAQKEYHFANLEKGSEFYDAYCLALERGWIEHKDGDASGAEETLTLETAVCIVNRASGRQFDAENCGDPLRLGLVEYIPGQQEFAELVEASIPHRCSMDEYGEHWTDYSALETAPEDGRYVIGNRLRIVQDGRLIRGEEFDGLLFNEEGYYTSGDPELDELVLKTLNELVPEDEMSREEKLRVVFDYCKNEFRYLRRTYYKNDGINDWWKEAATIILQTGKGNCYNYNSAFTALARQLGYPFRMHAGYVGKARAYHGWPTVEIDGETWLYDPELEMRYSSKGHKNTFYALDASQLRRYNYYEPAPGKA